MGFVIKGLHVTEKATMLQTLKESEANRSIKKFDLQKVVFEVELSANKAEIRKAVEDLYAGQKVAVHKINTITIPSKNKRVRGTQRFGKTSKRKKAIVTLARGSEIDVELS